jgi:hypothetical protein
VADNYDSTAPYCKNCKFATLTFNYRYEDYECGIALPPWMPALRDTVVRPHDTCSFHKYKEGDRG